jgi:hypothetical protein
LIQTLPSSPVSNQPGCQLDSATLKLSCTNWTVTNSWQIPADQVPGVYVAKMALASDPKRGSLIPFVIRDESRPADILFTTSDANWQAYNWWGGDQGGSNTYEHIDIINGTSGDKATKVSYDRPFASSASGAGMGARSWFYNMFSDHYPLIRFLERNGYNVNYCGSIDLARPERLSFIKAHHIYISAGHDEYWSQGMRDNIRAARDAGTNLAFFSANTMFEKIRFEDDYRTIAAYKQSRLDYWPTDPGTTGNPLTNTDQTAYFRDGRFRHLGLIPENELMGLIYTTMNPDQSMTVPAAYGKLRIWRNTPIAALAGTSLYTTTAKMLGYELDEDVDNGFRPSGLIRLSSTHISGITHEMSVHGTGEDLASGSIDHHMTLYRAPSGALVWATGSIHFATALDPYYETLLPVATDDGVIQQATVNMFADMGVQPASLSANLVTASKSTDTTAPVKLAS